MNFKECAIRAEKISQSFSDEFKAIHGLSLLNSKTTEVKLNSKKGTLIIGCESNKEYIKTFEYSTGCHTKNQFEKFEEFWIDYKLGFAEDNNTSSKNSNQEIIKLIKARNPNYIIVSNMYFDKDLHNLMCQICSAFPKRDKIYLVNLSEDNFLINDSPMSRQMTINRSLKNVLGLTVRCLTKQRRDVAKFLRTNFEGESNAN